MDFDWKMPVFGKTSAIMDFESEFFLHILIFQSILHISANFQAHPIDKSQVMTIFM